MKIAAILEFVKNGRRRKNDRMFKMNSVGKCVQKGERGGGIENSNENQDI